MSRLPASLSGMMSRKGEAKPPQDQPQRGATEAVEIDEANVAETKPELKPKAVRKPVKPQPAPEPEITKSLTLKLPMSEYKRLRRHALEGGTHQSIIATALREYLDKFE